MVGTKFSSVDKEILIDATVHKTSNRWAFSLTKMLFECYFVQQEIHLIQECKSTWCLFAIDLKRSLLWMFLRSGTISRLGYPSDEC